MSHGHLVRCLVFAMPALIASAGRAASIDPDTDKPYQLQVVLHIADHRSLTPVFRDQLEHRLGDGLQGFLRDMAHVSVVHDHPRLREIEQKGLQALDSWTEVDGVKTHFVLVDFVDGQYDVQARQHDGLTGLSSPVVRRGRTPDREFVARTAGLLISQDFGVVGTVTDSTNPERWRVTFRASRLGKTPELSVKKGDIFAVVQVRQFGKQERADRLDWALLRAEENEAEGSCMCRFFHRHPLAGGPGVGYRCVKLATVRGPLHLRLVEKGGTGRPLSGQLVVVQRRDFEKDEPKALGVSTGSNGLLFTDQLGNDDYEGVAFVRLLNNKEDFAHIPVVLVDDRTVVCAVENKLQARSPLVVRRELWTEQVNRLYQAQAAQFGDLEKMLKNKAPLSEVLKAAKTAHSSFQEEITRAVEIRDQLRAANVPGAELAAGDNNLKELAKAQVDLQSFIERQEAFLKSEAANKTLTEIHAKVERALILEGEGEFGQAIDLYKEAKKLGLNDQQYLDHLAKLEAGWELKGEKHREADRFIYGEKKWLEYSLYNLEEEAGKALEAFRACRDAGDHLRPWKIYHVARAHAAHLADDEKRLDPEESDDKKRDLQRVQGASRVLGKLLDELIKYLGEKAPAKP